MVSFDVESLFTNVFVKKCLYVVSNKLRDYDLSKKRVELLENCLDDSYFLFQGQYYL